MSIILDVLVIGIIVWCVIVSAKKGFVSVVVETIGIIVAFSLALTFSAPLAEVTYDKIIEPSVLERIESGAQETSEVTAEQITDSLPENIFNIASGLGINLDGFAEKISTDAVDTSAMVQKISAEVIKPVAVAIGKMAFTLIIFFLLSVVVKFLAKILNKFFSFSIIGKVNRTLGGVVGGVRGVLTAAVFCVSVTLAISLLGNGFWIFTMDNINKTFIFKELANLTDVLKF